MLPCFILELMLHLLSQAYVYNPVLIANVLSKTRNSKPGLMVHVMHDVHAYNPELTMTQTSCCMFLCEIEACYSSLIMHELWRHMSVL